MTILETIVSFLMLGIAIAVFVVLKRFQRKVTTGKKTMFPYVLLYRGNGDAMAVGTFAIQEHAVTALQQHVAKSTGYDTPDQMPNEILSGFEKQGLSWRGKDATGKKIHIWIDEIGLQTQTS